MSLPASSHLEEAKSASLTSKMHRASMSSDIMLKKKEQKDAELDRKIEALRKKNEALMKRYQEVEEDRRKAEQEGMAFPPRKNKAEDLTITIKKSPNEMRIVTAKPATGFPPQDMKDDKELTGRRKKQQVLVQMTYKTRNKKMPGTGILKNVNGEEEHSAPEIKGKPVLVTKTLNYKSKDAARQTLKNPANLLVPTSGQEEMEYIRWKQEREEIDRERVARHKNARGEWRRAWDLDKTENMFEEKDVEDANLENLTKGRSARKASVRFSTPKGKGVSQHCEDKRCRTVPTVSSKATGKDRLTGRARRWDSRTEEEFLEIKGRPDVCEEESSVEYPEMYKNLQGYHLDTEFKNKKNPKVKSAKLLRVTVANDTTLKDRSVEIAEDPREKSYQNVSCRGSESPDVHVSSEEQEYVKCDEQVDSEVETEKTFLHETHASLRQNDDVWDLPSVESQSKADDLNGTDEMVDLQTETDPVIDSSATHLAHCLPQQNEVTLEHKCKNDPVNIAETNQAEIKTCDLKEDLMEQSPVLSHPEELSAEEGKMNKDLKLSVS
ncbi:coiled-coil domain-containing protein 9B isoform X2 [Polypterus senegalus]|uniref:coiled-coil domain-containing protein 9B isoform X2 n=1 Tax=Polypterus senegalus TaxID=55291 RepID=UPI00196340AA|nr:coiled-coil domain-containing protein 9B isoform X2 [Polypterus senegalus]